MRIALDSTRIAHTAFSLEARGKTRGRGYLGPPANYSFARHIRTSTFL